MSDMRQRVATGEELDSGLLLPIENCRCRNLSCIRIGVSKGNLATIEPFNGHPSTISAFGYVYGDLLSKSGTARITVEQLPIT